MTDLAVSRTGSWVQDELTVVRKSIRSSAPPARGQGLPFLAEDAIAAPRHPSLGGSELDNGNGSVKRDALPVCNFREEER
jgi:hypothetical protein